MDTMNTRDRHPLAGRTVTLNPKADDAHSGVLPGAEYRIEDYWQNVAGMSWMDANGNPACMIYGMRAGFGGLPTDNEVVYGKIGRFGALVHASELGDEVAS